MSESTAAALASTSPTYDDIGASLVGSVPTGFHRVRRSALLDIPFDDARGCLFAWQVQLRSGVRVRATAPTAMLGSIAEVSVGVGPFRLGGPVRVIAVVDEPDVACFAYGTLPGHPESGEECFRVTATDGRVQFTIDGFSRPRSSLARLGAPAATIVQRLITDRYVRSLKSPA
ncbi:DUF1990 family protein [Gordonia neofelifaecis]|uniref:DUF1990 family protein n=1 Tax=Gordonia neofelifaecis TaxID=945692 RepID=UPI00058DA6A7|nr:DUF1990 domain-containing protein [Gordonia neofelifaecis]